MLKTIMLKEAVTLPFFLIILSGAISTQSVAQAAEKPATNNLRNNGLIKIKSNHSVSETINRLETILNKKGMTIFKRVNHTAGAKKVGLTLRPTQLLIFGNPKVGTPLILCSQTVAIDLPQKALAYKDKKGQVWLAYNAPAYLATRHHIQGCKQALQKIAQALSNFAKFATE